MDEPDLHIHVSMVAQLMETLQLICDEREAQLIVASHSRSSGIGSTKKSEST